MFHLVSTSIDHVSDYFWVYDTSNLLSLGAYFYRTHLKINNHGNAENKCLPSGGCSTRRIMSTKYRVSWDGSPGSMTAVGVLRASSLQDLSKIWSVLVYPVNTHAPDDSVPSHRSRMTQRRSRNCRKKSRDRFRSGEIYPSQPQLRSKTKSYRAR